MICVSIGRSRHRHMMAEHKHLVDQGAELVELRLDYLRGETKLKRLLDSRPCPIVVTCRREKDGGKFQGTEQDRVMLLRTAVAEGVEYIDLEEDIASLIPRFGKTKRIVSIHNFRETPSDLNSIHKRLSKLDPDIIKICTMANNPQDNLRMFRLIKNSKIPTVGMCMGDIGIPSRILNGRFGSPFTYATFHHERALAPGQLSFEQMTNVYHYDQINSETDVFAVIADPVGHSLSPLIHNASFAVLNLNKVYVPIRVPKEDLNSFIDEAPEWGIKGLSVTIPHKEAVLERLTKADESVCHIGASNTVVYDGGQKLGYNTDYRAAIDSLEEAMSSDIITGNGTSPVNGKSVLILGSGGVGKAIAFGLTRRGAKIILTDGVTRRAKQLAKRFKCQAVDWGSRHSVKADIIVNCTPIGMHPNVDETPFDKHHLRPSMVIFDAVYNPEHTLLINDAKSRNCKTVTGVDMFVRQACLQFKLFTGHDGPSDLIRDTVRRAIAAAKY